MAELRPYQVDAVTFLVQGRRALLALPPGAGKTAIVASALRGTKRILIVAPNGPVLEHWQRECQRWAIFEPAYGAGPKAHRDRARQHSQLVINYEAFRSDIDALLAVDWDVVIFDEAHRLKNRTSQTFKAAQKLAKQVDRIYLVTGTPILNRATEMWPMLHLMSPERYRSFWRWAEYHFTISYPRYRRRIVREVGDILPGHVELLRGELHGKMFYRPMKEILPDLPEAIETYYEVELSADERQAYQTMEENFWMEVGDEIVQAPNAIAKQTRLRQLASDWSCFGEPAGTKAKAAAALVEGLGGEQCVVFCAFRGTADATAAMLPDARAYHGGLGVERRAQLVDAFKAGELTTLVATIATLGEGVDGLQVARNAIFIDRDWTPARNEQAVGRLRRQGQKQAVNVMHIVAADTVDEVVSSALHHKADVIASVIESRGVPSRVSHRSHTVNSQAEGWS